MSVVVFPLTKRDVAAHRTQVRMLRALLALDCTVRLVLSSLQHVASSGSLFVT